MTEMSRRTFTLAAGGALACASFGASVQAMAQQQQDAAAESLLFLDPELREGARRVQKIGPRGGFDQKALAAARASTPSVGEPLLPQIPVSERRIPGSVSGTACLHSGSSAKIDLRATVIGVDPQVLIMNQRLPRIFPKHDRNLDAIKFVRDQRAHH